MLFLILFFLFQVHKGLLGCPLTCTHTHTHTHTQTHSCRSQQAPNSAPTALKPHSLGPQPNIFQGPEITTANVLEGILDKTRQVVLMSRLISVFSHPGSAVFTGGDPVASPTLPGVASLHANRKSRADPDPPTSCFGGDLQTRFPRRAG